MSPVKVHLQVTLSHWPADQSEPVLEQTIGDALRSAVATWGERTALVEGKLDTDQRRRWSFASLLEGAEQVARALLGRFSPGEHVAVWAANCPEWVLIEFGAHIAVGTDRLGNGVGYGPGLGAADINGGPYHVSIDLFDFGEAGNGDDTSLGSQLLLQPFR